MLQCLLTHVRHKYKGVYILSHYLGCLVLEDYMKNQSASMARLI